MSLSKFAIATAVALGASCIACGYTIYKRNLSSRRLFVESKRDLSVHSSSEYAVDKSHEVVKRGEARKLPAKNKKAIDGTKGSSDSIERDGGLDTAFGVETVGDGTSNSFGTKTATIRESKTIGIQACELVLQNDKAVQTEVGYSREKEIQGIIDSSLHEVDKKQDLARRLSPTGSETVIEEAAAAMDISCVNSSVCDHKARMDVNSNSFDSMSVLAKMMVSNEIRQGNHVLSPALAAKESEFLCLQLEEEEKKNLSEDDFVGQVTLSAAKNVGDMKCLNEFTEALVPKTDCSIRKRCLDDLRNMFQVIDFPFLNVNTIIKQCLDIQMWNNHKNLKSSGGFTLQMAITNATHCNEFTDGEALPVFPGIIAGNAESFDTFSVVYDAVAYLMHPQFCNVSSADARRIDTPEVRELPKEYFKFVRVSVYRSVSQLDFTPVMSDQDRRLMNAILIKSTSQMQVKYPGRVIDLWTEDENEIELIKSMHLSPKSPANMGLKDWPDGRSVYLMDDKAGVPYVMVKFNQQEHLQICVRDDNCNIQTSLDTAKDIEVKIEQFLKQLQLDYAKNDNFGYLNSQMEHLGLGIAIACRIKLVHLYKDPLFDKFLQQNNMKKCFRGYFKKKQGRIFDIQNKDMYYSSSASLVNHMYALVSLLIEMEQRLEKSESIDDLYKIIAV